MKYDVGVVGLGYVGLTLATALAKVGLRVVGVEKQIEIVDLTNKGLPHFSESGLGEQLLNVVLNGNLTAVNDFSETFTCDFYVITVGTPLGLDGAPRLDMIKQAASDVSENMQDSATVILRSTVVVGTTRNIVKPILDAAGKNYELAMCPERTLEGKAMYELFTLPQIVGADSLKARANAAGLFGKLTRSIVDMDKFESAEIVKLVDNTSRDISFAFANEVARVCDEYCVNAMEVIQSGKLGYPRTNVALPGLVGGPCLEKDPHIFNYSAQRFGIELEITSSARVVNERQPIETVKSIYAESVKRNTQYKTKIAVLGMAFKGVPETNDLRGSMSFKIIDALNLNFLNPRISVFDYVAKIDELESLNYNYTVCDCLDEAVSGASVIIIANNHPGFGDINFSKIKSLAGANCFIYDYWNHFSEDKDVSHNDFYYALGNGRGLGK